ncbi:hypothetical protein [Amycolatopsis sp. WAC 04169]|uniref:hypothetical protein n=1 Tax=unclassified Amycolatopsis TaxID=2618356 RepID=UPI0018F3EC83|nr:hypothetical protein [Amycolatopsis sp. WAC 04169]
MTTETNTAPVDDEATATEDLEETTPKPKPITAPVPPRPGTSPDGNWEPNGTNPTVN